MQTEVYPKRVVEAVAGLPCQQNFIKELEYKITGNDECIMGVVLVQTTNNKLTDSLDYKNWRVTAFKMSGFMFRIWFSARQ